MSLPGRLFWPASAEVDVQLRRMLGALASHRKVLRERMPGMVAPKRAPRRRHVQHDRDEVGEAHLHVADVRHLLPKVNRAALSFAVFVLLGGFGRRVSPTELIGANQRRRRVLQLVQRLRHVLGAVLREGTRRRPAAHALRVRVAPHHRGEQQ